MTPLPSMEITMPYDDLELGYPRALTLYERANINIMDESYEFIGFLSTNRQEESIWRLVFRHQFHSYTQFLFIDAPLSAIPSPPDYTVGAALPSYADLQSNLVQDLILLSFAMAFIVVPQPRRSRSHQQEPDQ